MRIVIPAIWIALLLFAASCKMSNTGKNAPVNPADLAPRPRPKSSPTYQRDSLYLHYTAEAWKQKKVPYNPFAGLHTFNIPLEKVQIWVDSILYSPDSLKLMAFMIWKVPNSTAYTNPNGDFSYEGAVFAGYREQLNVPWKVHEFSQFQPTGWSTYSEVNRLFREYYFFNGKFKSNYQYVVNKKGELAPEYFRYNLDEPEFWDKSVVWRKGARIPGYYNFQLKGNSRPADIDQALKPVVEVEYPKHILDRFR